MRNFKLIDNYNRRLNYLRISITDRCNLRCTYCQPQGVMEKLPHKEILTYEEILRIARIGVQLGISKIRVTGGEPLIRKGVYEFLQELTAMEGLSDVSLTTNAVLLEEHIARIRSAGIRRINISLDTLNPIKFAKITGRDVFPRVWESIRAAVEAGFHPVKLNVVALRGVNDDELTAFAELTLDHPYHVRFIEYMPMGAGNPGISPLLTPEIKRRISPIGKLIPLSHSTHDGPAERYQFEGARGEIGFISALSRHFCTTCNRLRLTASGHLRVCLLSEHQIDMKGPLRSGCTDDTLAALFLEAVREKPSCHRLTGDDPSPVTSRMSSIGG